MRIHSPHLVQVTLSDTIEQVLDVRADSPDSSELLLAKPLLNLDGISISHVDIDSQMLELFSKGAPGSLDSDSTRLNRSLKSLRNGDQLKRIDFLHV